MAHKISYIINKKSKTIPYAKDKHHDIYHAVALEEGIDIQAFLRLEQQVEATSKGRSAVKNFRENYFAELGISQVTFIKDES